MKKNTRFAFNAYLQQLARLNGVAVEELSSKFTVEPSVQQTLEDQIQQSAAFLTLINVTPVTEQSGQLLGLGVGSTIAGTTDTTAKEREPVDPTLMVDVEYKCEQTNFDTVLTYAKLDLWAKFQDFQVRIRDAIVKRQALDRIMIGFNGVKRAKTSNRSENPLLQDVNKGWLQKIREDAPDQSRARLHKAIGTVLSESNPASALNHLNHALQLDPRCGVKKDKQQLERRLRNDSR